MYAKGKLWVISLIEESKSFVLLRVVDPFFLLAGLVADGATGLAGGLATGLALGAADYSGLSFGFRDGADMLHNLLLKRRGTKPASYG